MLVVRAPLPDVTATLSASRGIDVLRLAVDAGLATPLATKGTEVVNAAVDPVLADPELTKAMLVVRPAVLDVLAFPEATKAADAPPNARIKPSGRLRNSVKPSFWWC